ncbi:hypothetical protein NMG60_11037113 [Bertholletia excelsa]
MESTDSSTGSPQPPLPPGFRFHPTDEELVVHYLKKKAASVPLPGAIIAEVDIYKFDPWELPAKATFGEQEWYFFSPRDRKYPNGARPNRAAVSGYWKATGTDKPVLTSGGSQKVGVKKALVFYGGKPPKGIKTNWIMHEYRLADNKLGSKPPPSCIDKKNSLRLDDWVLCRIYKKNNPPRPVERDGSMCDVLGAIPPSVSAKMPAATLMDSDHGLFQGIVGNNETFNASGSMLSQLPLKRTLPSLYWTADDGDGATATATAANSYHTDAGDKGAALKPTEDNGPVASLLGQLAPASSYQQQTMLGYQLPCLNWFS